MTSKKNELAQKFHPHELAFCGFSNVGKTTLIEKLIVSMKPKYDIGYFKHDAHRFEMDQMGKDTQRAWAAGAAQIMISDSLHSATIRQGVGSKLEIARQFQNVDLLFIEGYKNTGLAKIVMVDEAGLILDQIKSGAITNVIGLVGATSTLTGSDIFLPYFQRDQISELKAFIEQYQQKQSNILPLNGLVLAGGQSRRMLQDKASLRYQGKAQVEVAYELLTQHCTNTFVSCRPGQWEGDRFKHLPQIHDRFIDFGPLGGILSAMLAEPDAAWLVTACDLPFLEQESLAHLVAQRNHFKMATCYKSDTSELPEPLCTLYEPKSFIRFMQYFGAGTICPRKILINSRIEMLQPIIPGSLDNINYEHEYLSTKAQLSDAAESIHEGP